MSTVVQEFEVGRGRGSILLFNRDKNLGFGISRIVALKVQLANALPIGIE